VSIQLINCRIWKFMYKYYPTKWLYKYTCCLLTCEIYEPKSFMRIVCAWAVLQYSDISRYTGLKFTKKLFKVIPQFCIAHFYCAHLITYNFIHYTYRLKKIILLQFYVTSKHLVTFVQRISLKSMFSKKAYKSVARVPSVCIAYLFTCISRFNATTP
jgi:hypothetical protein